MTNPPEGAHMRASSLALLIAGTLTVSAPAERHQATSLPRYDRTLQLESTSETSANVRLGDVDGDGILDIVLAKGRHWPLVDRVLLGDGKGGIRSSYNLGSASDRSYAGLLVDLDGNGSLDVVISNDAPDPKLVYLNDGKGHFRVGSSYGLPTWQTRNASVADVNGDNRPDIIVANRSDKATANYICLNRGNGRFDAECTPFARYSATTVSPADINHDGFIDLVVPHRDRGQSYVYLGAKDGSFTDDRRVAFGPGDATIRITEAADFNGDGRADIVASDERTGITVYPGQAGGTFGVGVSVGDPKVVPYALTVGDLNGDKKPDIVVGHVEAPSTAFFSTGAGFTFTPVDFGDNKGTVYGFAIGDFDRDGRPDIAAARSDAPNTLYFAGPATGKR